MRGKKKREKKQKEGRRYGRKKAGGRIGKKKTRQ